MIRKNLGTKVVELLPSEIAGIVLLLVTALHTLGVVLVVIGGVWLAVIFVMFVGVIMAALATQRAIRKRRW